MGTPRMVRLACLGPSCRDMAGISASGGTRACTRYFADNLGAATERRSTGRFPPIRRACCLHVPLLSAAWEPNQDDGALRWTCEASLAAISCPSVVGPARDEMSGTGRSLLAG